jgi:hypothetical protein
MLALINRSGQLEDMEVLSGDAGFAVTMKPRGRHTHTETITKKDATALQLTGKDNYKKQPATMLKWRAVAACARVVFPDVILGLYTPEEMGAEVVADNEGNMTVIDVTPEPVRQLQDAASAPEAPRPTPLPNASPVSMPNGGPNGGDSDDASPIKRYICTQVRVVAFGNGKQVQLKRADGEGVIVLLGREKLLNAGYPEVEVSEWIGTTNKWYRLMPEAEVEAAFDGTKWDVGQIRMLQVEGMAGR